LSFSSNAAVIEVPVEVLDAGPRWYGGLAANFARVQMLVTWYGSDPDRYLVAIAQGTAAIATASAASGKATAVSSVSSPRGFRPSERITTG